MKRTGNLKKKVEESANREEKKTAIADAGMELTVDELDKVAGGFCLPKSMPVEFIEPIRIDPNSSSGDDAQDSSES